MSDTQESTGRTIVAPTAPPPPQPITARAVLVGLALVPVTTWWLSQIEYVRYSDNATTSALFFHVIAVLLLLTALAAVVKRVAPRHALLRSELVTIYVILVVTSALAGHDQLQILFTTLPWVHHHATPENGWEEEIWPLLPQHLHMTDPRHLEPLFLGDSTLYEMPRLVAWAGPILWWSLFAFAFVWTLYCLAAIFRRQWENERLCYPIVETPLEVTAPGGALFRQPAMWIAFGLAAAIQFARLAHQLWPVIPNIPVGVHNYWMRSAPWNAMGTIPISSYPFAYGLAYFLPLQLAFSCWFFFWFARLEMVIAALFGQMQWRRFPYVQQQGVGAYLGVAVFVIWAARQHLASVFRQAIGAARSDDDGEPLSYPMALWGFLIGVGVLVAFSVAAGMQLSTALIYFALLLAILLTITRLRAELGLPTIELYQVGVDDVLQRVVGARAWSPRDLTVMTLFFWLTRTHRQTPMPCHVDAMRLGQQCPLRLRGLSWVVLGGSALAIIASFWALLHCMYPVGFDTARFTGPGKWAFGNQPWQKLDTWLAAPMAPDYGATAAYGFGLAFTLFLAAMRTRFVWWPFHPAGYLASGSFGLFRLWVPIFVTWLVKSALLRYGGLDAHRKARPFFIGLILGEFSAAFVRTIIDLVFDLRLPPTSGIGGL